MGENQFHSSPRFGPDGNIGLEFPVAEVERSSRFRTDAYPGKHSYGCDGRMEVSGRPTLGSGVILLSVYQDIRLSARVSAGLGFFMAIAFGIFALVTAIRGNLSGPAAICVVSLL